MNIDSGWAAVVVMLILAIAGGVGKLIHMMYRMEQEITGTAATLKDHGRRLDSLEAEVKNVLQLILRHGK
jgi:cell division protein FtsL